MFKLILLFNLKKLILNKEIEKLYFAGTHKKDISTNLKTVENKTKKYFEEVLQPLVDKADKSEEDIVELSKLQAEGEKKNKELERLSNIQNTYTNFSLEITYFSGLAETIKANFWKLF